MQDDLLAYYNAELGYLRDLGGEFARKFPKVAARLLLESDKCEDPHVERLLEGFAFLAARIHKKLDDELPEITEALLSVLYPHLMRPLPSMSIVQFTPAPDASKIVNGYRIAAGAMLNTRPVGGEPCRFRTAYPATLWPIEIVAARLDPDRVVFPGKRPEAVALLTLTLQCAKGLTFSTVTPDRMRFYVDGEGPVAHALYEYLFNDVCQILVRGKTASGKEVIHNLPLDCLKPVGLDSGENLTPSPPRSFPGYQLLQEYFAFPEKFLFGELSGLDRLKGADLGASVDVLLFARRPPRQDLSIGPDNFRLGCAPVVNLFSLTAEPISLNQMRTEYRVVADAARPTSTEVYTVDDVTSAGGFLEEASTYEPFYSMRHASSDRAATAFWYATRRASERKDDSGTEVYLTFVDPHFNPRIPAVETITVRATCTNRDLPSKLPFGGEQGDFSLEGQAPVSRVRCLKKPTRTLRPPARRRAQWRLISHLALNHLSLADSDEGLNALRELLSVYDFASTAATRQQIMGVSRVSSRRTAGRTGRALGNAVCMGVEIAVEFDETQFVGSGMFLLASVLERFMGHYTTINSFTQLVATSKQREGVLRRWLPRAGERTLL
jgi:type VI secretion system protein ImpG